MQAIILTVLKLCSCTRGSLIFTDIVGLHQGMGVVFDAHHARMTLCTACTAMHKNSKMKSEDIAFTYDLEVHFKYFEKMVLSFI